MMKHYKTIIWDFNGTIIDDVIAALGAVNDMLALRGQRPIDIDRYKSAVDVPIWKFYETVFEKETITPEVAVKEFNEFYEDHLQDDPLMDGVLSMLKHFSQLQKRQVIISASNVNKVKRQLTELGIIDYFDEVLAHSDFNAEDKTYLAKEYFSRNALDPLEAVVIGDCVFDYVMAKGIGCDCILNTRGHQGRREFCGIDATVIDSLLELKNIII